MSSVYWNLVIIDQVATEGKYVRDTATQFGFNGSVMKLLRWRPTPENSEQMVFVGTSFQG